MNNPVTPFELGRQHKLAGVPLGDKRVPYPPHSKDWVRYQCGRQSIQCEQAKAEREAKQRATQLGVAASG